MVVDHNAENGRPLGAASGGDVGFWDRLGTDEAGMPRHLPMGVVTAGQGPVGDDIAHHYVCWCGDVECPLALALGHAWKAGRRVLPPEVLPVSPEAFDALEAELDRPGRVLPNLRNLLSEKEE